MKRILIITLTLVFALTLSACGGKDKDKITCADDQVVVNGECVGLEDIDDLTPEQISDLLIDEFDGGLGHLGSAMQSLNFDDASEMRMEGTVAFVEDGVLQSAHMLTVMKTAVLDGRLTTYQMQEIQVEDQDMAYEMITQEVDGGINMYFNLSMFLEGLPYEAQIEVMDYLAAFNVNADWVMFHFEDSLENMVEVEVIKDFFIEIIEEEFGMNAWTEIQAELELEAGFDLDQYNLSIPAIGALLEASDYTGLQTYLENIDIQGLQAELEQDPFADIPGIDAEAFQSALMDMNEPALFIELQTFDFEMLVTKVSEGETAYAAYVATLTDFPQLQSLLAPLAGLVGELETEGVLTEIAFIAERMSDFDQYFDFNYYVTSELAQISAEVTANNEISTTVTIDPENFPAVFEDLVTDVYWFVYEFPNSDVGYVENLNCPSGQICDDFNAFDEVTTGVTGLDPFTIDFLYNPNGDKSMSIKIDAEDFMQSLANKESVNTVVVNKAEMEMTMSEAATITIPTGAANVQSAIDELIMLQFVEEVRNDLRYMQEDLYWSSTPAGIYDIYTFPGWNRFQSAALNDEMTVIEVTAEGDLIVTLYWLDGSPMFDGPLSHYEMDNIWELNMYSPTFTRAKLLNVIGLINETEFSSGKALVYSMFN